MLFKYQFAPPLQSSSGSSKRQKTSRKGKKSKIDQQFAEAEMDVDDQGNDKKVFPSRVELLTFFLRQ